jgi:hypothetical protein
VIVIVDGVSSMIGVIYGLVSRMKNDVPCLVGIHSITQKETLIANDTTPKAFLTHVRICQQRSHNAYEWVGKSYIKCKYIIVHLLEAFDEAPCVLMMYVGPQGEKSYNL